MRYLRTAGFHESLNWRLIVSVSTFSTFLDVTMLSGSFSKIFVHIFHFLNVRTNKLLGVEIDFYFTHHSREKYLQKNNLWL